MNLIKFALQKPISIIVLVLGLFFFGIGAVKSVKVDILPKMDLPVLYLAHPFTGYTPDQMESYFGKNYINIMLLANGVKSIETKNLQGLTLMKVSYYEGTNMAQATAELSALTNRVQAIFPPGSQPPIIIRFDSSTLPIGQLVLSSKKRSNNELQDMANIYVRSSFTSVPGLLSPAPFGGSPRTIEVNVDPAQLRAHNLTPDQIVEAIKLNNQTAPSGNVRVGEKDYLTPTNNTIKDLKDFEKIPLFKGDVQNLYLGDVATVKDGADIITGYALVNGKRSVYLNIAKAGDASTWEVVKNLKAALPKIQSTLPEDVKVSYEFDQSVYVMNSVKSLITEGVIGAVLTGIMVILFLGDRRAALIVILTIPISIISGVLFLKLFGQTINLMSLSGLALAIGILVDESTVTIENIHQHLDMGKPKALAIWDACKEIALPKLLILLCILAVFAPAFTMTGIPGSLFLPLALAIAFSMVTSFLLSQTFVPIMANWIMKDKGHGTPNDTKDGKAKKKTLFEKFSEKYQAFIDKMLPKRKGISWVYLLGITSVAAFIFVNIGQDVFPKVNSSQFQLRLRAPDGTRLERTEEKALSVLNEIEGLVGKEHIGVTSVYVGKHAPLYALNPIYLFMAGSHEAVLQVSLKDYHADMDVFKDQLRARIHKAVPDVKMSFEAIELTDKVLGQGSPTPIEIRLVGKDKKQNEVYANKIMDKMREVPYFRDVQIGQSIHYPALDITIDRVKAAQLGVDMNDISRSLVAATSSSRYTEKNIWIDEKVGFPYSVQVQVPLDKMNTVQDINEIPLLKNSARPVLGDVASIEQSETHGQNNNLGAMPYISITANTDHTNLSTASTDVKRIVNELGELPRGLVIEQIGLGKVLVETMSNLNIGLLVAIVVIFLMLSANYQSFKVSFVVLTTVPAVILGSLLLLLATNSTLNLQSYMGIIMAVGVSIANAVLLVTNAEQLRKVSGNALEAAKKAASLRLRPIIMTSVAMIAGMLPMAIGHGEGGEQVAPLGRAVIGGLLFSTFTVLLILPLIFTWIQNKTSTASVSLDPEDTESKFYINKQ
ncbi:multidrug efflux pump subunit AcrB [Wenyingzhuangia heitensis]|uniref:Multidrug efflux pump subunit AcrB n=1 Tax=Wenyingzhuangia heitensis TaxID=1487859 RepID=A0ABX0UG72_9FLAO|nr:efflux RND transporter permease subunit [Wenyingzhuangia heitensis]NIJ46406.1 multidrug efflux pump subunit AcrB [Wenyingzhuangia heitensis]